jgi:hypothetical protein
MAEDDPFRRAEMAERALERQQARLHPDVDWGDRGSVREHCRDQARARRQETLDALAPERRCPSCREVKIRSRQWEVLRTYKLGRSELADRVRESAVGSLVAVCRSCAMRHFPLARG